MKNIQLDSIISTAELAELLMISPRRVAQLAEAGAIPKRSRGKFLVSEAVPCYLEFRRDASARRAVLGQAHETLSNDLDD